MHLSKLSIRHVNLINTTIVLACVGLLFSVLMMFLAHSPEQPQDAAKRAQAVQQVQQITHAVKAYLADHAALPTSLNALVPKYLPSVSMDPWGHAYAYDRHPQIANITCYGKNGKPRGYGVDLDIIATVKVP